VGQKSERAGKFGKPEDIVAIALVMCTCGSVVTPQNGFIAVAWG